MRHFVSSAIGTLGVCALLSWATCARANIPGGGTNGPNVTLTDTGNGAVTMANGIVSIVCVKSTAVLTNITYIYNNSGITTTNSLLAGGKDGGEFYYDTGGFGTGTFAYSIVANNTNYCEIDLVSTSTSNGVMDVHFSMLRGSPGFYATFVFSHRAGDEAMGMGEARDNLYLNPEFAWNSIDANRNFQYNLGGAGGGGMGGAVGVFGAPVEVSLWTNGISTGRYEDKYKYTAPFGTERAWGWSSVNNSAAGFTGRNIGIWNVLASAEYYNGGPMKEELMDAPMINNINGGHYQTGNDSLFGAGETWTRVTGPYFVYCNNITNAVTNAFQAAEALYTNALAQAAAEQSAWPYYWFTNSNYAPASGRGTVSGQFVISDSGNPATTASNLWVGVVQQPVTVDNVYDFQQWMKPYQFWVQTDAGGSFTISNVIAGANYTLYAFGQGAEGTFMSQNQAGGNPPLLYNLPAAPFSVTVTAGATTNLGTVTWTPSRVGATVFEIGYPDRTGRKFRHGEDWWVGDIGPSPTNPMPVWSKFLEYPFDFPSGPNYVVGQSRWATDWNFIQPVVPDSSGNFDPSTSTITFNLATAPTNGALASLYLGLASDFYAAIIISVNGSNLGSVSGVTGTPNSSLPANGFYAGYGESDTSVREGINAAFSDERLTFPGSLLQAGQNTITITWRQIGGSSLDTHMMYDYLRLELTGYVPPPPAGVSAYAGNDCNLICWPVVPGATSYNLLRSTTSGGGFVSVTNGVIGPLCGSGWNNAAWLDTTAVNGTPYYYVVRSANPTGTSTNSPQSSATTPSAMLPTNAPAAPAGLAVSGAGHHSLSLSWNPSADANFYTVYRSTLVDTLGGASNTLRTIVLNNNSTGTSYTDTSPTDGSIYSYSVTATGAGGASSNSAPAAGVALPAPPAGAPGSLTGTFVQGTNVVLDWSPVSGAVGYIIRRATNAAGPYGYIQNITETTYTDGGLSTNVDYFYQVTAVNAAGTSSNAFINTLAPPPGPGLNAMPGNGFIWLNWSASTGATNYVLQVSTNEGGPYAPLASTVATNYLELGLANGTGYYYVVYAVNANGQGPLSAEASAVPFAGPPGIYWNDTLTGSPQSWDVNGNWIGGSAFPSGTQAVAVVNSAITANQTINLDQSITLGGLNIGAGGGAAAFNIAANGGTLTLDNTPGMAELLQLSTSAGDSISAPVAVNGNLLVTNAAASTLTLSGNISGAAGGIIVAGNVTLSGNNTYSGGTTVNSGLLLFGTAAAIPAGGMLTLNNNASMTVTPASTLANVTVNGVNTITGNGLTGTGIAALNDAGTLTLAVLGGSSVFDLTGTVNGPGTLVLGTSNMSLRFNGAAGSTNTIFNLGAGTAAVNVRKVTTSAVALGGLIGGPGTQLQGDNTAGGAGVTYTVGEAGVNTEFDGAIKDGSVSTVAIVKTGAGSWTLAGANTYSGGTTVGNGTLMVNNPAGSGTGTGLVTVAGGGALGGNGMIAGAVTIQSGGTLAPGNPTGTLTASNSVTLNAGSITVMQINRSALTSSALVVHGGLGLNGALTVTNLAGTFAAGDSFKLFSAGTFSGGFSFLSLPPLANGLLWNTNALATSGTLSVISIVPSITTTALSSTNFIFGGTNGQAGAAYYLLGSTNLALPVAGWPRLATNHFDSLGNFQITNGISTGMRNQFYLIQVP